MAKRVLVGKRGNDFGVFVSKSGVDVTNSSSTTPLAFDSNAIASLLVHSFGQGILVPEEPANASFTFGGVTYTAHEVDIAHGLGYTPAFAARWCTADDISSGVAQRVWTPHFFQITEEDTSGGGGGGGFPPPAGPDAEDVSAESGMTAFADSTNITLKNRGSLGLNTSVSSFNQSAVYFYSYVIFSEENFLGGGSL